MKDWAGSHIAVGDRVYVDYGDSLQTGGEVVGEVTAVDDQLLELDGRRVDLGRAVHIQVLT